MLDLKVAVDVGELTRKITLKKKADVLQAYKCPMTYDICYYKPMAYATGKNIFLTSMWNILNKHDFSCG